MEDPLALSIRQFVLGWQAFGRAVPGNREASLPGMELRFSGLPSPFFNVAVLTEPVESADSLRELAGQATAWAAPTGLPWFLVLTHEALAPEVEAQTVLGAEGFVPVIGLTGMVADDVPPRSQDPEGLDLILPQDDASCAEIIALNEAAYGMSLPGAAEHLGRHAMWQNAAAIGKVNGQPVSCSAILMLEGYRYVCLVASHPDHRRRGYADAAMRRSLAVAAQANGPAPTFLHATDAGRPVYEKMGYKPVSAHTAFMEGRFAAGH